MNVKKSILVCFVAFFVSCSSSIDYPEPMELFNEVREMTGREFILTGVNLNNPMQVMIFDSLLVIVDNFQKEEDTYFCAIVNRHTGELYRIFGRKGRGPDEFNYLPLLTRIPGYQDRLGVNNLGLFSYSELSIPRILAGSSGYTLHRYNDLHFNYHLIAKFDEQTLVGTGFFPEGRFALTDTLSEIIAVTGAYPFEEQFKGINKTDLGMAFQSSLSVHPEKPWMAAATRASANLDILKLEGKILQVIEQVHSYPPLFEGESTEVQSRVSYDRENRMGYRNLDVTSTYIYVLYSGKKRKEGFAEYAKGFRVLVFDWAGNPVIQLNLDREVLYISVDATDETLYAISTDENDHAFIIQYDLDLWFFE